MRFRIAVAWVMLGVTACSGERTAAAPIETTTCRLSVAGVRCSVASTDPPPRAADGNTVTLLGTVSATATPPYGDYACALVDGAVFCWGVGSYGQLGDGVSGGAPHGPVQVPRVAHAIAISASMLTACALADDGKVWCWGSLSSLGVTQATDEPWPTIVQMPKAHALGASLLQTCAATSDGARCWGGYYDDVDGHGQHNATGATLVPGTAGAIEMRGEGASMCAVWRDGHERCWWSTPLPLQQRRPRAPVTPR